MSSQVIIREIKRSEIGLMDKFLYNAIYQPEGAPRLPEEVIYEPRIYVYIADYGSSEHDYGLVAEVDGNIVGMVWTRITFGEFTGYGYIDDQTPEFCVSLLPEYQGKGIGTKLMLAMIEHLKQSGYERTTLSVNIHNTSAMHLYEKCGFKKINEIGDEALMMLKL